MPKGQKAKSEKPARKRGNKLGGASLNQAGAPGSMGYGKNSLNQPGFAGGKGDSTNSACKGMTCTPIPKSEQ